MVDTLRARRHANGTTRPRRRVPARGRRPASARAAAAALEALAAGEGGAARVVSFRLLRVAAAALLAARWGGERSDADPARARPDSDLGGPRGRIPRDASPKAARRGRGAAADEVEGRPRPRPPPTAAVHPDPTRGSPARVEGRTDPLELLWGHRLEFAAGRRAGRHHPPHGRAARDQRSGRARPGASRLRGGGGRGGARGCAPHGARARRRGARGVVHHALLAEAPLAGGAGSTRRAGRGRSAGRGAIPGDGRGLRDRGAGGGHAPGAPPRGRRRIAAAARAWSRPAGAVRRAGHARTRR